MSLTFLSKSLNRTITFSDLDTLSVVDLRVLLGELHVAIESMEASLATATRAGTPDPDWVHGVTKKQRICKAFYAQAAPLVEKANGPTAYQQLFQALMHAEFKRELGSVYDQIMQDAHNAAISKLHATGAGGSSSVPTPVRKQGTLSA